MLPRRIARLSNDALRSRSQIKPRPLSLYTRNENSAGVQKDMKATNASYLKRQRGFAYTLR